MARFPLGMYTLPDGVRTRHDGSKSTPSSVGLPVTRPFIRLIVGLRGGTSGGAEGGTPSRRQPLVLFFTAPRSIPLSRHSMVALNSYEFIFCVLPLPFCLLHLLLRSRTLLFFLRAIFTYFLFSPLLAHFSLDQISSAQGAGTLYFLRERAVISTTFNRPFSRVF